MHESPDSLLIRDNTTLAGLTHIANRAAISFALFTCAIILLAWLLPDAASALPAGWKLMHISTAISGLLSVLALILLNAGSRSGRRLALSASLICLAVALLSLLSHSTLNHTSAGEYHHSALPPLMSVQTALFFTLFSLLLLTLQRLHQRNLLITGLSFTLLLMCIYLISGYLFSAEKLYAQSELVRTSPQTLFTMFCLTAAVLTHPANPELQAFFIKDDLSGHTARLLLPLTLAIPVFAVLTGVELVAHDLPMHYAAAITATIICSAMFLAIYSLALKLRTLELEIQKGSASDELTGLYNLKGFHLISAKITELAIRHQASVCIIYFDLDGLKTVNDTSGHEAGSDMIRSFGKLLKASFREADTIARVGGDEFVVLCVQENPHKALQRLKEHAALQNQRKNRPYQLSYSCGWACSDTASPGIIERLMMKADMNMYQDKRSKKL